MVSVNSIFSTSLVPWLNTSGSFREETNFLLLPLPSILPTFISINDNDIVIVLGMSNVSIKPFSYWICVFEDALTENNPEAIVELMSSQDNCMENKKKMKILICIIFTIVQNYEVFALSVKLCEANIKYD